MELTPQMIKDTKYVGIVMRKIEELTLPVIADMMKKGDIPTDPPWYSAAAYLLVGRAISEIICPDFDQRNLFLNEVLNSKTYDETEFTEGIPE